MKEETLKRIHFTKANLTLPLLTVMLFFCFQRKIEDWLWNFCSEWLACCNEAVGGCVIVTLALCTLWHVWVDCRKMKLSQSHIAWLAILLVLYTYYRFGSNIFFFWGFSWQNINIAYTDLFLFPLLLLIKFQFEIYANKTAKSDGICLLENDEPIRKGNEDLFSCGPLIESLIKDLNMLDLSKGAFSVGIAGEWGLGKSSFFNLFKERLKEECRDNIIIVEFNPRFSTDLKDIQKDFFDTFATQLAPYYSGISRDMRRYQAALQLPEENFVVRLLRLLPSLTVINGRAAINKVVKDLKKKIFVFIDDFDRLTAEEILEVMKVIDRNGDFHQTIYVTAYDKAYVNSVLKKHLGYAQTTDYTDKYFSYELHLPSQPMEVLRDYVKDVLEKKLKDNGTEAITVKQMQSQWNGLATEIVEHLHTLRHVKRFLNVFLCRYDKVRNDVNFNDFVRVSLLRYFDINAYHALVEGKLTKSGGPLTDNSGMILFLADDLDQRLKLYSKWEGAKQVMENLFRKSTAYDFDLSSRYKRLQFKGSFACYFFDYQPDGVYHKDLMQLYNADTDDDAIKVLYTLIKFDKEKRHYDQGSYVAVENFLRLRPTSELRCSGDVLRLFRLLCHLNSLFMRPLNIESFLGYLFTKEAAESLSDIMEDDYKGKLGEAIRLIIGEDPFCLAYVILQINELLLKPEVNEGDYVFTQKEIVELAELCQRYYLNLIGTIRPENFDTVIAFTKVMTLKNGRQVMSDKTMSRFIEFIQNHANDFIQSAFDVVKTHTEIPKLRLSLKRSFVPEDFFPYQGTEISEWIGNYISSSHLAYIFIRLLREPLKEIKVNLPPSLYNIDVNDLSKVYEVVKGDDELAEEKKVQEAMKQNVANSIVLLSKQTGVEAHNVKEAIERLKKKNVLSSIEADIADYIPKFEPGDFVRLKDNRRSVYDADENGEFKHNCNIYEIKSINIQNVIKLVGVTGNVPVSDIEAIPIDGIHDKNIYYDPVVIPQNGNALYTNYSYYLMSFETFYDENGKKFTDIVKERNYHFVHEIQHWLKEENVTGLKINYFNF